MTDEDFVRKYLGFFPEENYNKVRIQLYIFCKYIIEKFDYLQASVTYLAGVLDSDKDGLISFAEFQTFEGLLCAPDALYKTAFQLFDTNGNGAVSFGEILLILLFFKSLINTFTTVFFPDEFVEVIKKTELYSRIPVKLDGPFARLYFGKVWTFKISQLIFTLIELNL